MFDDIGGKIKTLAKVITVIGFILSFIVGLVLMIEISFLSGLLTVIFGCLAAWIGSFLLYGFGELIDNTARIEDKMKKEKGNAFKNQEMEQPVKQAAPTNDFLAKYKTTQKTVRRANCPHCYAEIKETDTVCSTCGRPMNG